MRRGIVFAFVIAVLMTSSGDRLAAQAQGTTVDVYRSATCECCHKWVEHMRAHGFTVQTTDQDYKPRAELRIRYHVPRQVASCHTALVGGYVIEGHVPASDVQRLLAERPAIVGLAAAGMPIGSPGMETPGRAREAFDVVAFDKAGDTSVFARHDSH